MKHCMTRISFLLLCGLLLTLLAACGSSPVPTGNNQPGQTPVATTAQGNPNPTPTTASVPVTQPMPATETSCPAADTARAAVMTNLVLGQHNTFVYAVNEFQSSGGIPTLGTLKRYDVATNTKTVIKSIPNVSVGNAQISSNGQWILFTTYTNPQYKLQLVRMDGQGLQTLFCSSGASIDNPQWSFNMRTIIFSVRLSGNMEKVELLTINTGDLQTALTVPYSGAGQGVHVETWLDNTHVYLTNFAVDSPHDTLYILNTNNGANQSLSSLPALVHKTFGDFDSSVDGHQLYVDYGHCGIAGCNSPGNITMQTATGGTETTILNEAHYTITSIRSVTANTLLLTIANSQAGGGSDNSHNGLWKMQANGSGLTRLTTDPGNQSGSLNTWSQYPWSNVSRDNGSYALQLIGAHVFTLEFGSLSGGAPTVFASISDGTTLATIGWTTM